MGYDYTSIDIQGLQVLYNNYNQLTITHGLCIDKRQEHINIKLKADTTINIYDYIDNVLVDTFYYVYILKHKDKLSISFHISTDFNYSDISKEYYSRLIGIFRTDNNKDIIPYMLIGNGATRNFAYINSMDYRILIHNGRATSYTDISCWSFIPEIAKTIIVIASNTRNKGYIYITDNSWNNFPLIRLYGRDTVILKLKNYYQDVKYHIDNNEYARLSMYAYGFDYEV